MKFYLFSFLILLFLSSFSQKNYDTILTNNVYSSYFSYKLKQPVYVSYTLYKGGGDCSRQNYFFKNDTKINTAKDSDYDKSGYDKGHLANSEDFAYDCKKNELTFRYYNCLPQTPNLNRGIWKKWENIIREKSQTDSLLIICGGVFKSKKIIGNNVFVPDFCFKIVQSIKQKKLIWVLLFSNDVKNSYVEIKTLKEFEKISKYKLSNLLIK